MKLTSGIHWTFPTFIALCLGMILGSLWVVAVENDYRKSPEVIGFTCTKDKAA